MNNNTIDLSSSIINAGMIGNLHFDILINGLKLYANSNGYKLDWDVEDGEQWGRILSNEEQVLIFHSRLPLIFVNASHYNSVISWLKLNSSTAEVISIISWDKSVYILSSMEAKKVIKWNTYKVNSIFSINDLWYHTI